jgi:hypothetical protein
MNDKSYFHELKVHPNSMVEGGNVEDATGTPDPDWLESDIKERLSNREVPILLEVVRYYKDRDQRDPWQHCDLHRFIIPEKGQLRMQFEYRWRDPLSKYRRLIEVDPNGMANFYGLRNHDILCIPGSNRELMIEPINGEMFKKRPLTIEVWRGQFPEE